MITKCCAQCGEVKLFDPTAKKKSKASGFHQGICWDCYLENQREVVNRYYYREKRRTAVCATCGETIPRCYYYKDAGQCYKCYKVAA